MGYKITIDGPSGSGKGYLASELSKKINYVNVDTGAFYRAIGLFFYEHKIDIESEKEVKEALQKIKLSFVNDTLFRVFLNDKEVTKDIRTEQVGIMAAKVAKKPCVREYITKIQRRIADNYNVIMEGRDIGSVVLKDADVKIFLTADFETRVLRRYNDLKLKNPSIKKEEVFNDMKRRDLEDENRKISPLKKTEDMIEINNSHLTKEELLKVVLDIISKKGLGEYN